MFLSFIDNFLLECIARFGSFYFPSRKKHKKSPTIKDVVHEAVSFNWDEEKQDLHEVLIPGKHLTGYYKQTLTALIIPCILSIPQFIFAANFSSHTCPVLQSMSNPVPQGDFETLSIPLKRAGNLLLVEARIGTIEGNFILDTGAPYLVLNKTYFRHNGLLQEVQSAGVTGGSSMVYRTRVDRLEIDDLFYEDVTADVVNLGHLEDGKGMKILGLLGVNLFAEMEMEVDVANDVLYLHKLNEKGERVDSKQDTIFPKPALQIPIDLANNMVFINASVQGAKLRFCLDTGAEISVLSNSINKRVLQNFQLKSRNILMGSGNEKVEVIGGELNELLIGGYRFSNMQVVITGLGGLQAAYNTTIHGILGYNFLAEGRVIINFKKKQLSMYFYNQSKVDTRYFSALMIQ